MRPLLLIAAVLLAISSSHGVAGGDDHPDARQQRPRDLLKQIEAAGFNPRANLEEMLKLYVRFGTAQAASKYVSGDQFDRSEVRKTAESHQASLRNMRLRISNLHYDVYDSDELDTKGLVAPLSLPLRVYPSGGKPFHHSDGLSGALAGLHPSECIAADYWFLTKDGHIQRCGPSEAAAILKNGGVIYRPEVASTTLMMIFGGEHDRLKDLARNRGNYLVEMELQDLSWVRQPSWGYFRRDSYFDNDRDCQKLRILSDLFPQEKAPSYFVTMIDRGNDASTTPEIVQASLASLMIASKSGALVGGYGLDSSAPQRAKELAEENLANDREATRATADSVKKSDVPGRTPRKQASSRVRLSPSNEQKAKADLNLGKAYLKIGKKNEAKDYLKHVMDSAPDSAMSKEASTLLEKADQ